ncbi:hypothetical protein V2O64_03850 [Verrucomicrobiaceae bacterium 227]
MKTLLISFCVLVVAGVACALPPQPFVHIKKIEGVVIEIPKDDESFRTYIKLTVTSTTSAEDTKKLYSTIRRKTRYRIQDLKRPKRDEVILVLRSNDLPKGMKVGDKLRVIGYGLRGSDVGTGPSYTHPYVGEIERNPKG